MADLEYSLEKHLPFIGQTGYQMSLSLEKPTSIPTPLPKLKKEDDRVGYWFAPAVIQPNNFVHKSLSNWSFNIAVGCSHACKFCYVPSASTIKQGPKLREYGVQDADLEWGDYVLLRPWEEDKFLASLRAAENVPLNALKADGNRAVMFCTTTDAYQAIRHPNAQRQKELTVACRTMVRRALELIRDQSTLNVRIMTRSPMARLDFDLFKTFGHRLTFGMSLPTLRNDLAKVYEPRAPAPTQRLATLRAAREAGLHVYVAMAPTYPECDEADLRATLTAVADLDPITVFHEPINIRAENIARIEAEASHLNIRLKTEVFSSRDSWQEYALGALKSMWTISSELEIRDRVHLWPDKALGSQKTVSSMPDPVAYQRWLSARWSRISEWPKPASSKPSGLREMGAKVTKSD